ncbi:trypsin-like serine peptidase [Macrococcoides caseolyticum]|uniref:trypsin-like serine peptidase n=1 Tax=Macrococcoides caseolyticum TaxID=69966 RepID=UPI0039C999A5
MGSVISKNTVLTAAHCVYSGQKETPENINITPAQNNEKNLRYLYYNVFHIPPKYKKDFDYNYDIALINVNSLYNKKMIGENVQPLRIKILKYYN